MLAKILLKYYLNFTKTHLFMSLLFIRYKKQKALRLTIETAVFNTYSARAGYIFMMMLGNVAAKFIYGKQEILFKL